MHMNTALLPSFPSEGQGAVSCTDSIASQERVFSMPSIHPKTIPILERTRMTITVAEKDLSVALYILEKQGCFSGDIGMRAEEARCDPGPEGWSGQSSIRV